MGDHKGTISWEEFNTVLTDPALKAHFDVRGIDIKDAHGFFDMLTTLDGEGNTEVEIETFVAGCLRMKGMATSVDLQTLRYEVKLTMLLVKVCLIFLKEHTPCLAQDAVSHVQS